jgi:hypothetical protein
MNKPLTITAPNSGVASSVHVGYGMVVNLDIHSIPGIAQLNYLMEKKSSTTVTALPQWAVKNPATPAEIYVLDSEGEVYKSADSGATWALMTGNTAGGHGNGLTIFKNYLIVARDAFLDVCGNGTATGITNANWSNSWKAIDSDVLWHPMIISKNDGKLYGGAGRYVYSLEEDTTFDPATAITYTYTQKALDLPVNYRIKCLEELGNNLMCGTWMGTNYYDNRVADIFPWDRSSPSFGQPVQISENGVHAMLNYGNILFCLIGLSGKVFISDGVGYSMIAQIPITLTAGNYLLPFPGAIANFKDRVFFGVSFGSGNLSNMGVWSVARTSRGNLLTLENLVSSGNDGTSNPLQVGCLLAINQDTLITGWRDNATYGMDKLNNALRATSGYFISPFYQVGTPLAKRTYEQLETLLAQVLTTGQSVVVSYRTDLSASFTDVMTLSYSVQGGVLSFNATAGIPASEFLQMKVTLTTGATNTSPIYKNISLK